MKFVSIRDFRNQTARIRKELAVESMKEIDAEIAKARRVRRAK